MKSSDLKDQTVAELQVKSRDLRQQLFKLRLQKASSQLEKPSELRNLRRSIARVETRISELRKQAA
ncbi:MAG: 50S ribosomal protein L29 [Verrucomicrobiales bacterium]|jgi:large subunit ribosomal protein L29|nr:50S ribosomal protein L29 [Verrucomicrobiales bacterium]